MGVKGLKNYILKHSDKDQFLRQGELHNCNVIFDGSSLASQLYRVCGLDTNCGGSYGEFSDTVTSFFDCLQECKITAYVIFDGAEELEELRKEASLEKARQRLADFRKVSEWRNVDGLPPGQQQPIFVQTTFEQAIRGREHVRIARCDFSARREIAALAHKMESPVFSDDSDFFVHDIPLGAILQKDVLDRFHKLSRGVVDTGRQDGQEYKYIRVTTFFRHLLLKFLNIQDQSALALMASLVGDDILPKEQLKSLFGHLLRFDKDPNEQVQLLMDSKYVRLMEVDKAIKRLARESSDATLAESLLQSAANNFLQVSTQLDEYFNSDLIGNMVAIEKGPPIIPYWFYKANRGCTLSLKAWDILTKKELRLPVVVEDFPSVNVHECALSLRQAVYRILYSNAGESVLETVRDDLDLVGRYVKSTKETLPPLDRIEGTDSMERTRILLKHVGIDPEKLEWVPQQLHLVTITHHWWKQKASPSDLHLKSVSLAIVMSTCVRRDDSLVKDIVKLSTPKPVPNGEETSKSDSKRSSRRFRSSEMVFDKSESKLRQPMVNGVTRLNNMDLRKHGEIMHAFSQFQACIFAMQILNDVLMKPFADMQMSEVYNGPLMYKLYKDMKARGQGYQPILDPTLVQHAFWEKWYNFLTHDI